MPTAPRSRFLDVHDGRLHLLEWGPPAADAVLLLLHGFNQTAHSWEEFGARLPAGWRAVAVTQRGHGDSLRAPDGDYSREVMVGDIEQALDALGLAQVAVVAASMGAVHGVLLANRRPSRVRGLALVDWAPEIERLGRERIQSVASMRWPSLDAAVQAVMRFNPRRTEANIRSRLSHTLAEQADGRWGWRVDPAFAQQARWTLPSETMWAQVRAVSCPTLLVRGADSDLLSADIAERVVESLPDGALVTVTGAGHSVAGDNPGEFAAALVSWLEALPRGA